MDETRRVWDRQSNEPTDWYDRFFNYLALGAQRSVLSTYKAELESNGIVRDKAPEAAPSTWYKASKDYNWKNRATAYDDAERMALLDNEDELRARARALRIDTCLNLLDKINTAIQIKQSQDIAAESGNALSQASRNTLRELREELEGHSTKTAREVTVIVESLPSALKDILKEILS